MKFIYLTIYTILIDPSDIFHLKPFNIFVVKLRFPYYSMLQHILGLLLTPNYCI